VQEDQDSDTPEVDVWKPDAQLIAAILAGDSTERLATLDEMNRAWLIAHTTRTKVPAAELARLLDCSVRTVRAIAASAACKAFIYAQTETDTWVKEAALAASAKRAVDLALAETTADLERTRGKLGRLIDAQIVGMEVCGRCSTPWDKGNTYWYKGTRYCRCCQARRNRDLRARKKDQVRMAFAALLTSDPTDPHADPRQAGQCSDVATRAVHDAPPLP
jgi:hypothetical protein